MRVSLLTYTPLWVCSRAIRTCWDSHDKSDSRVMGGSKLDELVVKNLAWYKDIDCGMKDKELIERVGNKNKHKSVLEHIVMSFEIDGISRACLQELARHRIASLSVKSTRYTLKELKEEEPFDYEVVNGNVLVSNESYERADKYIVFTGNKEIDHISIVQLDNLRKALHTQSGNDTSKYTLPECYKTRLVWTINARSLQNFLELRSSSHALWEIRRLARKIYKALPLELLYLFKDYVYESDDE